MMARAILKRGATDDACELIGNLPPVVSRPLVGGVGRRVFGESRVRTKSGSAGRWKEARVRLRRHRDAVHEPAPAGDSSLPPLQAGGAGERAPGQGSPAGAEA